MKRITFERLVKATRSQFRVALVPQPQSSVRTIFDLVGSPKKDQLLTDPQLNLLFKLIDRRLKHQPLQYMAGSWNYDNLKLKLRQPVFIPRPETLQLVEHVLKSITQRSNKQLQILEVGSGSGIIPLLLAHKSTQNKLNILSIDKNKACVQLSNQNKEAAGTNGHNIEFKHLDLAQFKADRKFDLIVSNPPYIPSSQVDKLERQVRNYEDRDALDGGADGQDVIRKIVGISAESLNEGGQTWLQIDESHYKQIKWVKQVNYFKDLFKKNRFAQLKL